jgi:hypothetical protein
MQVIFMMICGIIGTQVELHRLIVGILLAWRIMHGMSVGLIIIMSVDVKE